MTASMCVELSVRLLYIPAWTLNRQSSSPPPSSSSSPSHILCICSFISCLTSLPPFNSQSEQFGTYCRNFHTCHCPKSIANHLISTLTTQTTPNMYHPNTIIHPRVCVCVCRNQSGSLTTIYYFHSIVSIMKFTFTGDHFVGGKFESVNFYQHPYLPLFYSGNRQRWSNI